MAEDAGRARCAINAKHPYLRRALRPSHQPRRSGLTTPPGSHTGPPPASRPKWPWIVLGGLGALLLIGVIGAAVGDTPPAPVGDFSALTDAERATRLQEIEEWQARYGTPAPLPPPAPVEPAGPLTSFGDGTFVVGEDIEPGTYNERAGQQWDRVLLLGETPGHQRRLQGDHHQR